MPVHRRKQNLLRNELPRLFGGFGNAIVTWRSGIAKKIVPNGATRSMLDRRKTLQTDEKTTRSAFENVL